MQNKWANKSTAPKAGGLRQFPDRALWAARVGEFCRRMRPRDKKALYVVAGIVVVFLSSGFFHGFGLYTGGRSAHRWRQSMTLQFSHEEHAYIVDNPETDLMLTELGMRLILIPRGKGEHVVIDGSQIEYDEFLGDLREEFVWKSRRLKNPQILIGLAQRLLPNCESIEPMDSW